MPIDLQGDGFADEPVLHHPGAYDHVLQRVCEEDGCDPIEVLTLADWEVPTWRSRCDQRIAELVEQRGGEPVHARSYQLPECLPGRLFARFPVGGQQRCFSVTADDMITLKPLPEERR